MLNKQIPKNRDYLAPQIRNIQKPNNHWSCDYPLASCTASMKARAISRCHHFGNFSFLSSIKKMFSAMGFKILPTGLLLATMWLKS